MFMGFTCWWVSTRFPSVVMFDFGGDRCLATLRENKITT